MHDSKICSKTFTENYLTIFNEAYGKDAEIINQK